LKNSLREKRSATLNPGVATYLGGVFSEDQLRRTIEIKSKSNLRLQERLDKLQEYKTHQEVLSNEIAKIESYHATLTLEINPTNVTQAEGALSLYKPGRFYQRVIFSVTEPAIVLA
jgi:hypothetical protein